MNPEGLAAETWAHRMGYRRVAGADEAGRGALAGPLVAAAVILPQGAELGGLRGLDDSKRLSPGRRQELFARILESAESWSFACVSAAEIDGRGLQESNIAALREALAGLSPPPDLAVVDYYRVDGLNLPQWSVVHADRSCRCVAAASILAKVIRDHLMWHWWVCCPQYGFERHKGYGTALHLEAIAEYGPAACHRGSFRRVAQMELIPRE